MGLSLFFYKDAEETAESLRMDIFTGDIRPRLMPMDSAQITDREERNVQKPLR